MNENYVTNLSYLKVTFRPKYPKSIKKLLFFFMKHSIVPFVKIIAILLKFGIPEHGIKRYPEYMLKIKDGTRLATDIYVPRDVFKKKSNCSTMLVRLPYWKESLSFLGYLYASYGFVTIIQDIRGTGHSEGFNYYLFTEREDGLETLEWISKQYWYNHKIGMTGGSYFGITQLALSWDNKLLTSIIPAVTSTRNLWKDNGGLQIHALTTSIYRIMVNIASHYNAPEVYSLTDLMQERYLNPIYALFNEPFKKKYGLKLSQLKGKTIRQIQDLLITNYIVDNFNPIKRNFKTYFKFLNDFLITRGLEKDTGKMPGFLEMNTKKFSQPAFMIAGWHDMFFEKQLEDFLEIKANATGDAGKYSKMIIGSWAHGTPGHPESRFRNAGLLRFYREVINLNWNRYWLKADKHAFPDIDKPSIKYWVMGKNIWRYTESWPPKYIEYKKLYIHSQGNANSVRGDGILNFKIQDKEPRDEFRFDPMNPVITKGGRNLGICMGARNQKNAEKRNDVFVYSTKPLEMGIEIAGPVRMVLYASSSAQDTDFMVKLVDVYPRGKAINILDAGIRARYRNGENNPSLIEPNQIYKFEIILGNTSNYFRKSHRIRIEITSSNFPRFDVNSNLGGERKGVDHIIADQKVYHNQNYPSHLILPIFKDN